MSCSATIVDGSASCYDNKRSGVLYIDHARFIIVHSKLYRPCNTQCTWRSTESYSWFNPFLARFWRYRSNAAYTARKTVSTHLYHVSTRSSAIAEGPRDTLSVEVLSTAAQLYKNWKIPSEKVCNRWRWVTSNVNQNYWNCRYITHCYCTINACIMKSKFPKLTQSIFGWVSFVVRFDK